MVIPRLALLAAALSAGPLAGATYQWDTNGSTAGLGGDGTWNLVNTNWDLAGTVPDDGTATTVAVGSPSTHTFNFGGTAGTVTLGTSLTATSLTFGTAGYLLQTGANTLTFSGTITANESVGVSGKLAISGSPSNLLVATGKTLTVDAVISGSSSLRKQSPGTLNLTAENTYTGGTLLVGGTTNVSVLANGGSASSIGASSNAASNLTFNGGALVYVGTSAASTDRLFSLTASTFIIQNNATSSAHSLTFSNTGSMVFNTANQATTMTLSGSNTGSNSMGLLLKDNGTGAFGVTKSGGGRWVLGNSGNTFTGVLTVSAGTLSFASSGALGGGSSIVLSNGASTGTLEATAGLTIGSGKTITVGNSLNAAPTGNFRNASVTATTFEVASLIANASGASNDVELASATGNSLAILRLSNDANSFGGNVRTGFGVFEYTSVANGGVASALGAGSTVTFNNSSSLATFRHVGAADSSSNRTLVWAATTGGLSLESSGAGSVRWLGSAALKTGSGSATLTLGGTNTGANELAQVVNNSGGTTSLTKAGAGTWTLSGNNTFSGAVNVNAGTLKVGHLSALGTGAVTVSAGTLDLAGYAVTNLITLSGGRLINAASLDSVDLGSAPRLGGVIGGTLDAAGKTVDVSGGLTVTGVLTGDGASFTLGEVTLADGAVHAPGNSPGIQEFGAGLVYEAGSILEWEFAGNTLTARGTDYDGVDVTGGTLTFDALAIIRILNLNNVDYTAAAWSAARSFDVVRVVGPATYSGLDLPTLDIDGAGNFASRGSWSVVVAPDLVSLNWTPVPEPSVYGMVIGGLALAAAVARRRKRG